MTTPYATIAGAALAAGLALALAAPGLAQAKTDLSGFWMLKSDPTAVPAARPTTAGAQELKRITSGKGLDVVAGSPEYASLWCTVQGLPHQSTSPLTVDIRQGPIETVILPTVRAEARHIYTDGQRHPEGDSFDPTTVGHSIGRWQGDVLVVDTVGFSEKGTLTIPGGGVRSPKSHLVERYRLKGLDTLLVTSTWTDRDTLKAPHTYIYEYARAQGTVWMIEPQCNPIRDMRAKGLPLPVDAPQS